MDLGFILLATAIIIISCIAFNKLTYRFGIPMLLAFIVVGMLFGVDGVVKIHFDDFGFAESICSVALIFIMFYGGFSTSWKAARPIAPKAILLSSLGTILTALLVGVFCHLALGLDFLKSLLIGSVISSTDAASVFSILRSRKLNLRYNTASVLEMESGSNDPFAYMLTVICLTLMGTSGGVDIWNMLYMIFAQVVYGAGVGVLIACLGYIVFKKFKFDQSGFDSIFLVALSLTSYAISSLIGGNGFLAVYITGICLGNSKFPKNKKNMINFFDGIVGLLQMVLFFLLGLLATPSQMPSVAPIALVIALFLTFVARPVSVFAIMSPFRSNFKQQLLVSWSGLRGAASIVFAIMAIIRGSSIVGVEATFFIDVFNIVFLIVLFSILLQGTMIPPIANWLGLVDKYGDVMRTFNDYVEEVPVQFIQFSVTENHPWINQPIKDIVLPPSCILVLLERESKKIIPNGRTIINEGDTLILSGNATDTTGGISLSEKVVSQDDELHDKRIYELPESDDLIIMINRADKIIIPRGSTKLKVGDVLVINNITQ